MKLKNKGRKIYKTKEKNYYGKTPLGKFFSGLLTVVLIGGVGFLGYSVAGPMIDYSRKQGDEEPKETSADEKIQETATAADTTGDKAETKKETPVAEVYKGVQLTEYEVMSADSIKNAIERIPQEQGIKYIAVPLKIADGRIMYDTAYEEMPEISKTELSLSEIVRTIKKEGYTPTAYISVFPDNIIPQSYPQYSYMNTDTMTAWQDIKGNMWGSPFSEGYVNYIKFISGEMAEAGFRKIVCSDIKFPDFTDRDLIQLNEERLENPNRYTVLARTADKLYSTIESGKSEMMLEVNASDILSGKAEILNAESLMTESYIININLDEISKGVDTGVTVYDFSGTVTENLTKMLDLISDYTADRNITVRISGTSHNTSDLIRALDDIAEMGYTSFILG